MGSEVRPVVAAGIEMEFVRDFPGREDFVEGGGTGVETEIVIGAAVEINFQSRNRSCAGQSERTVALPESRIGGQAEDGPKHAGTAGSRHAAISGKERRKFFDQRRAVSADRRKQFRMSER